jgi:gas vesicle protein
VAAQTKKETKSSGNNTNKLKNKLRSLKESRQPEHITIHNMQKKRGDVNVPSDLADTYAKLKKLGNPIISPIEALENAEEIKNIVETIQNMPSTGSPYVEYYRSLKKWLDDK